MSSIARDAVDYCGFEKLGRFSETTVLMVSVGEDAVYGLPEIQGQGLSLVPERAS